MIVADSREPKDHPFKIEKLEHGDYGCIVMTVAGLLRLLDEQSGVRVYG